MTSEMIVPVFGLVIWLASIFIDSKFGYKSPYSRGVFANEKAPPWKRTIVNRNSRIRYGSLFFLWISISSSILFFREHGGLVNCLAIGVAVISIVIYAFSLAWPAILKDSETERRR